MSKKKRKQRKQPQDRSRWLIGGAVLLAVVVIVGFKVARDRASVASAVQEAEPTNLPTREVGVAEPSVTFAVQAPPTAPAVAVAAGQDAFPASPAAQVEWAMNNKKPAMVLFHSTTCIPCKAMEKLVAQVRGDYEPEIVFIDVVTNDRANIDLIRQAGIQAIPTTFFLNTSGQGKRYVGAMKEDTLRAELDALMEGN